MACNVFGAPITNEILRGMAEYHNKEITQQDRAKVAMEMKNADGKDINARAFAMTLRERFEGSVTTMCMIYNATGSPIRLCRYHRWAGHLGESPLPVVLLNGQWGVFVHGNDLNQANACVAAVVYSANNNLGKERHWLISWSNRAAGHVHGINKVHAEIRDTTHYNPSDIWDWVAPYLNKGGLVSQKNEYGGMIFLSIGQEKTSTVEAILTLSESLM